MKKHTTIWLVIALLFTMLAGCGEKPEAAKTPTEGQIPGISDLPIDELEAAYAQQIGRYYPALAEKWEIDQYFDGEMSVLPYYYYEGDPLRNVGYGFVDLDGDSQGELVIGAIWNAEQDPSVFEIWTLVNGKPRMLVQGGTDNRYALQYVQQEQAWYIANDVSNSGASWAAYYLQLKDGKLEVKDGVLYDMFADEQNPWFQTQDMDWYTGNDQHIDEATANSLIDTNRAYYTHLDYTPYASYEGELPLQPQLTPQEQIQNKIDRIHERYGIEVRIPKDEELSYSHYDAYAMVDLSFSLTALEILEESFSMYPEGYLRQLAYGQIETVRFELVGGLKVKEDSGLDPNSVNGFAQNRGSYYLVVLNGYFVKPTTIFHELSHITDARLLWDSVNRTDALFSEETWLALQPEGFYYAMRYTDIPAELSRFMDMGYFSLEYAMTFPTEDRAILMALAMDQHDDAFVPGSGHSEKMKYYAACIRDSFDTTGWPEVTAWEQVLQ